MSLTNDSSKSVANDSSNNASNACIVCYKNAEYYSIGMCEHPVCYECSTRMRVLCQQNECPICRQDLPKVVFTKEIKPFRFLRKGNLVDSKYNIYFDNHEVREKFLTLLAQKCSVCEDNQFFNSFNSLKEHMRRKHDLHYCDLCVENLKIFSHERRCYTKAELTRHRRKGDLDDKSHKGHPLCEFCEQRYMDNDELYRHLRRDHLFCHFCDADGLHQYYSSYDYLREHFRQEHHLCEEGGCADEQFTSVFRTEIDLKAHKASVHGRQLGKAAAKQARTLELEFTLAPRGDLRNRRGPPGSARSEGNNHSRNHHHREHQREPQPEPYVPLPAFVRQPLVDVQSTEEFPTLGNASPSVAPSSLGSVKGRSNLTIRGSLRQGNYDENFPALGPESSSTPSASASVSNSEPTTAKTLNFSLSSSNKASTVVRQQSATPNLSIHVNHRPNGTVTTRLSGANLRISSSSSSSNNSNNRNPTISSGPQPRDLDFPALGRSVGNLAGQSATALLSSQPQQQKQQSWTKITCVKPAAMPKAKKVAPAPQLGPALNSGEDFPSLAKGSKTTVKPPSATWVQVQSSSTSNDSSTTTDATKGKAKKKKMKQQQQTTSNGNTLSSDSTAKSNFKSKDLDAIKKDKSKTNNKQNSEHCNNSSSSNNSSNNRMNSAELLNNVVEMPASVSIQRKRSELKIDSLNTTNNNTLSVEAKTAKTLSTKPDDFPALGRNLGRPPGLSSPPPGFTVPPPPGFLSRPNGLTFTNSSGESYAIVPEEAERNRYAYLPPTNFQRRNQNLIAEFNNCFGGEESEELKAFRYLSGLFRTGVCDADQYYKQCRTVMGAESFKRLFPELLALLPDIEKQRELFEVHRRETNAGARIKGLEACANCGQILRSSDLQAHATSHTLENHFPALGTGTATAPAGTWSKK